MPRLASPSHHLAIPGLPHHRLRSALSPSSTLRLRACPPWCLLPMPSSALPRTRTLPASPNLRRYRWRCYHATHMYLAYVLHLYYLSSAHTPPLLLCPRAPLTSSNVLVSSHLSPRSASPPRLIASASCMSPSQVEGKSVEKDSLGSAPLMAADGAAQIFEIDAHRFRSQVYSPRNVSGESEGLEMASLISTTGVAFPAHNKNAAFAPDKHATVATEGDDFFKVRAPHSPKPATPLKCLLTLP